MSPNVHLYINVDHYNVKGSLNTKNNSYIEHNVHVQSADTAPAYHPIPIDETRGVSRLHQYFTTDHDGLGFIELVPHSGLSSPSPVSPSPVSLLSRLSSTSKRPYQKN